MPLNVCANGHLTGFRHCTFCGTKDVTRSKGTTPPKLDRRDKLRINQMMRLGGELPVADLRKGNRK